MQLVSSFAVLAKTIKAFQNTLKYIDTVHLQDGSRSHKKIILNSAEHEILPAHKC